MGIIKHPKLEALERECSENLKAALDEAEATLAAEPDQAPQEAGEATAPAPEAPAPDAPGLEASEEAEE